MINDLDEVQFAYLLAPTFQFVNSAGKPITGGWMEVYIHGTRTKYYCVSDWDGTLHPFKIPLDSLGSNIVLASPANAYDVYVYNRFGSLIMSRYNVIPSTGGASGVIPATITIESDDDTVNVSVSGNTYNISISDTVDKLNTVSGDVEELKEAIASGFGQVQADWEQTDTTSPSYIQNKPIEKQLVAGDNIGISVSGTNVIIAASGTDLSDYATHTEVNNVSGGIISVVSSVSSTLQDEIENIPEQVNSDWNAVSGKAEILNKPDLSVYATNSDLQLVSSAIPDVSNFTTRTEVNSVSSILENEIQTISGAIPEPFEGYTSPSGTSYIDNVNYIIEQSNSAIDIITINDWNPTGQMEVTSSPDFIGGFTARTNEIKLTSDENTSAIVRIYKEYNGTEYIEGEFDNSSSVTLNLPDDYLNREVWFYYDGWIPANITIWQRTGEPIEHEVVRELAWKDDVIAVSASIPDVSDFVSETELTSAINVITSTIPQAQVQSNWAETDTSDPSYIQNKPDEINIVAGSGINIVASGTELIISASATQQVPNVDIVSPSGSIVIGSSIDPITNTKTFSIDVATVSGVEYGQFYATNVTGTANMAKTKGNLSVNEGKIQLHKGQSYHVTIRGTYTQTTLTNALDFFNFIEYVSFRSIPINVNKTISAGQYWEISYDVYNLAADTDYIVAFTNISNAVLSDIFVEVHSLAGGNGTSGSASGVEYTAGYGIQILNDVISVSGINPQVNADWNAVSGVSQVLNKPDEVSIVAGSGINITESNNQLIITSTVTGGGGSGANYTAGDHIDITNDTISVTGITELVAGTNITITMNSDSAVISAAGGQQVQSNWDEWDSSSPAYIQNKPYIPESPVQSDWNETDSGSLAYIRNKPNITDAYTGASGIAIDDSVISLDEPLGIVAGSGINIVIEGDSAIICVSGVSGGGSVTGNYQEGYGIDINNNTISVDTTIIPAVSTVSAMINAASANDNLFIATYNVTTPEELWNAVVNNKYIVLKDPDYYNNFAVLLTAPTASGGFYHFHRITSNSSYPVNLQTYKLEQGTWSRSNPEDCRANWNETSSSKPSYILNKPVEANLLPGSGITITASGSDYVIGEDETLLYSGANVTPSSTAISLSGNLNDFNSVKFYWTANNYVGDIVDEIQCDNNTTQLTFMHPAGASNLWIQFLALNCPTGVNKNSLTLLAAKQINFGAWSNTTWSTPIMNTNVGDTFNLSKVVGIHRKA